ncbi:hypothetical protein J5277_13445, partial [Rhizobium sp. 16-449-1b]|uniref:hypothetical protein n=1 Tax=Rhizobium sp. 16-449-1b TaxID=2819989 RepID=UPI001ADCC64D
PRTPPPTFLFLLIFNCQITDQSNQSKFPVPNPKLGTNQHRSQFKEIQSESHRRQQRRRPRSVKRLIRLQSQTSQQAFFKKSQFLATD